MSRDGSYNGWSSYETWLAKIWIDEGYAGGEAEISRIAERLLDAEDDRDDAIYQLAKEIKDRLMENRWEFAGDAAGLFSDLLTAAISQIDFEELATAFVDDLLGERRERQEAAQ